MGKTARRRAIARERREVRGGTVGGRRAPFPSVDGVALGHARVDADLATTT